MMRSGIVSLAIFFACSPAWAINIVLDYTYDTSNFFGAGNPGGAAEGARARSALEQAASYFTEILDDTFSTIETPAPFSSQVFNGVATWQWTATFNNPGTGSSMTLMDPTIAADEYRIYAGARSIGGNTLGIGGPGGFGVQSGGNGGGFTQDEINQINAITDSFFTAVETRGEPAGEFARWGGAITFDSDTDANWHFDHMSAPGFNENDFFSTAIHELGHAVGFGTSSEWSSLVSGGAFTGAASRAANGNVNPTVNGGHWTEGTMSTVFGTSTTQEVSMDPSTTSGERILWTTLDAAGLTDIGWTVVPPAGLPGDYNNDGFVTAGDYTIWRDSVETANEIGSYAEWQANFGATAGTGTSIPEPTTVLLVCLGALISVGRRIR